MNTIVNRSKSRWRDNALRPSGGALSALCCWLTGLMLIGVAHAAPPATGQSRTLYSIPAPDGLMGWWTGDGNPGASAGNNKARLYNGADYAPGKVGPGFSFDGLKNYVKIIATAQEMEAKTGLTVELWVNPTDISYKQPLLGWSGGETAGVHLWLAPGQKPGLATLNADIVDAGGASHLLATGAGVVAANSFQHIALTYNETTGDALLYVNSRPVALQLMDSFKPNTRLDLWLGRHSAIDEGKTFFQGVLDEISVYNRALSAAEIESIYKAGGAGKSILVPLALETSQERRQQVMQQAYDDRLKNFMAQAATATMGFEALIDGSDEVHIQGDQLWYQHRDWSLPGIAGNTRLPTRINLRDWTPVWNGNTSDKTKIDAPLPITGLDAGHLLQIEIDVLRGGGTVTIQQLPTPENGYETILLIDDGANPGAHWYTFNMSWSIVTVTK